MEFEIFEESIHLEFGAFLLVELRFVSNANVVFQELAHLLDVNPGRRKVRRNKRRRAAAEGRKEGENKMK